ncbi:hypothetical protein ACR820_29125 [Streptomyces netropsis]
MKASAGGAPLAGVTVTFTVSDVDATGTSFASTPVTAVTGPDGIATTNVPLTAGGTPGDVYVVAQAGTAVTAFGLHVGYTSIDELLIVGGDGQQTAPGTPFAEPMTVLALRGGQPLPSLPVHFHLVDIGGTGSFLGYAGTGDEDTTDSTGRARTMPHAGPGEGDIIVTATGADKTVIFRATVSSPPFTVLPGGPPDVTLPRSGQIGYPGVRLRADAPGGAGTHRDIRVDLPQGRGLQFVPEAGPDHRLTVWSASGTTEHYTGTLSPDGQTLTFTDVALGLSGTGSDSAAWVAVRASANSPLGTTQLTFHVGNQTQSSTPIHVVNA